MNNVTLAFETNLNVIWFYHDQTSLC